VTNKPRWEQNLSLPETRFRHDGDGLGSLWLFLTTKPVKNPAKCASNLQLASHFSYCLVADLPRWFGEHKGMEITADVGNDTIVEAAEATLTRDWAGKFATSVM
jgi:hypothetical protein